MFARALVNVGVTPWIFGDFIFHVRAPPVLSVTRLFHQLPEAVLPFGVIPVIDFKSVQGGSERGDLRLRRGDPGLLGASGELGDDNRRQNAEYDQHQQQFD
jgi:hypothetical protein